MSPWTIGAFALGFLAIGVTTGLLAYHANLAWFIAHWWDHKQLQHEMAQAITLIQQRMDRPRHRWIGSQGGRHLAKTKTMPQKPREGPQERGTSDSDSAPVLTALEPAAARHARRLHT
jgi:hypothetical protein